ncbi:MAG TPA: DUF418 domain-containing protein [Pirellulales bacterium]
MHENQSRATTPDEIAAIDPVSMLVPATLTDPVACDDRISAVDVLRGVALLGILLINITSFGLPCNGKGNLLDASPGDVNTVVWFVTTVLFKGKMRALFSMLFGASVILLTERFERRGDGANAADIYYRRTLWLLAIGLLHGLFLWEGDILSMYGLAGLFLYPFRKLRGRLLVVIGALVLFLTVPAAVFDARRTEELRAAAIEAKVEEESGAELSREQHDDLYAWQDAVDTAHPDAEAVEEDLAAHRGGYWGLFAWRNGDIEEFTSTDLFDAIGMMLIGMGLLKLGVITAGRSIRFYAALAIGGFAIGLPLQAFTTWWVYHRNFNPIDLAWVQTAYDPGRLAIALAYVGLTMLIVRAGILPRLTASLAAVGRTALTNYLATTLICTTLFNGYGLGLFGSFERYQLYFVVLGVWAAQLAISPIWLRYFLYGPAEWGWRSLTYWKLQSLRRT